MKNGKAAVFLKPYQFEIRELPTVPVDPDGILVKIYITGAENSNRKPQVSLAQ